MRSTFFLLAICCCIRPAGLRAQDQPFNAIKLYVMKDTQAVSVLPLQQRARLFSKLTQLINQTGVAEEGYSNFYVVPTFDTVGFYVDDAGPMKIYTVDCELNLRVEISTYGTKTQHIVFTSVSKRLTGSASRRPDALFNAISAISAKDPELLQFFQQAKVKISAYFKQHCHEVIADARQAEKLKDYTRSIALYFSVPSDAPADCYQEALSGIQKTYSSYVGQACNQQLLWLKAFVARAQTTDSVISADNYDRVMYIIQTLDPASPDCYGEAKTLIDKIEKRFDKAQAQAWELKKNSVPKTADESKRQVRIAAATISIHYSAGEDRR